MNILVDADDVVLAWMSQKIGMRYTEGTTLGVLSNDNRLVGGVLFLNITAHSVDLGIAGRGFAYRSVWQAIGDIAFGLLGCVRLQAVTRSGNEAVRRLLPRLKFKFEARLRKHYGDDDGLMFSLLKHEAIALGYYQENTRAQRA